mgnify:CR=1 FL=1
MQNDLRIEAKGLHKLYEEGPVKVHAVKGVDLRVKAGSLVLLIGPSGSGKTTLLSMLGCILRPTEGELRIMGRPIVWDEAALPLIRRRYIGFVFQHFNLFSSLTASENVEVALKLRGIEGKEAKKLARGVLEAVGLEERWNFLPRDLSGGEKQRVSIARALAGERAALKDNRSVVVVSHDARILEFANEVYRMEDGLLQGVGGRG